MSTQLKIKVTKEVLGKTKWCKDKQRQTNCAISYAIREFFPNAAVNNDRIAADRRNRKLPLIHLPLLAQEFIISFDFALPDERPFLPELEFTIDIPDEVIETIDIESLRPLLVNHPTLELA